MGAIVYMFPLSACSLISRGIPISVGAVNLYERGPRVLMTGCSNPISQALRNLQNTCRCVSADLHGAHFFEKCVLDLVVTSLASDMSLAIGHFGVRYSDSGE